MRGMPAPALPSMAVGGSILPTRAGEPIHGRPSEISGRSLWPGVRRHHVSDMKKLRGFQKLPASPPNASHTTPGHRRVIMKTRRTLTFAAALIGFVAAPFAVFGAEERERDFDRDKVFGRDLDRADDFDHEKFFGMRMGEGFHKDRGVERDFDKDDVEDRLDAKRDKIEDLEEMREDRRDAKKDKLEDVFEAKRDKLDDLEEMREDRLDAKQDKLEDAFEAKRDRLDDLEDKHEDGLGAKGEKLDDILDAKRDRLDKLEDKHEKMFDD
jgi:hypothetical protein